MNIFDSIYVEIKDSFLLECENGVTGRMFLLLDVRSHSSSTAVSQHRRQEFSIILLGKPQKLKFMISQWLQKEQINSKFYFIYIIFLGRPVCASPSYIYNCEHFCHIAPEYLTPACSRQQESLTRHNFNSWCDQMKQPRRHFYTRVILQLESHK